MEWFLWNYKGFRFLGWYFEVEFCRGLWESGKESLDQIQLKIKFVTIAIIGFLHFLNSLLSQQHNVSASRSVSVFRWKVEESPSELDPLGRAVFFSNTRLLLLDLTQPVAYKSLSFEEQEVQSSEIWRGAVGRTISRSFEESGSRTAWSWSWHYDHSKCRRILAKRHNVTFENNRNFRQHRCETLKCRSSKFDFILAVHIFVINASTDKCT